MDKSLHILFISRATLFTVSGGDTVQLQQTAAELRNLGVRIDIKLCNDRDIAYSKYDLIHFFNIIRPADIIYHIKKSKLPYVVSTIYVDYSAYEQQAGAGIKNTLLRLFDANAREYIKAIARMVVNREKIISPEYMVWGQKRSVRYVLKHAAMLLPNSENEYRRLLKSYGVVKPYKVIPNAADKNLFVCDSGIIRKKDPLMVLCVARVEGRKNQLTLIRALNNTPYQLYIIGNPAPNHTAYYSTCKSAAAENVHFVEQITQNVLREYYQRAKVHILPSWFETTGLSSLEALFCGCSVVVTAYGDTLEYFEPACATYCDPASEESVRAAVKAAAEKDADMTCIDNMRAAYNWKTAAVKTLEAYKSVLEKQ